MGRMGNGFSHVTNVFPLSRLPVAVSKRRFRHQDGLALGRGNIKTMVGNHAVAKAVAQAMKANGSGVTSAYPITPATEILHEIRRLEAEGLIPSVGFNASSEHEAMSAAIGASFGGTRSFIATSSVGFLHMLEMVRWAGQNRTPIVMGMPNRADAPLTIWFGEEDRASARDGTVQLVAETHQQAYDLTLQSFRIAETAKWMTIINLAGFFISHSAAPIRIIPDKEAMEFLGKYVAIDDPFQQSISKGGLTSPLAFPLQRAQNYEAWGNIKDIVRETHDKFGRISGRSPGAFFNTYHTEDAEYVFFNYGFLSGTLRTFIDVMRRQGIPVGLISGTLLRPFPDQELTQAIYKEMPRVKVIGVFDGTLDPVPGHVYTDLSSALFNFGRDHFKRAPLMINFRYSGGQNPTLSVINGTLHRMMEAAKNKRVDHPIQQLDRNTEGPTTPLDLKDSPGQEVFADQRIIEFIGRGGLGAVSGAANMVTLINRKKSGEGYFAQGIPQFGSEKTGSPTSAKVIIDQKPITSYSFDAKRDYVFFREDLITPQHIQTLRENGLLLVNTHLSPAEIRERHQVPDSVRVLTIDASGLSREIMGKDLPNNVLLSVIAHLDPALLSPEHVLDLVKNALGSKGSEVIDANLRLISEAPQHLQGEAR